MNILQEHAEKIATTEAEKKELGLMSWIARNGIIKTIFGRWLFIWCDMRGFTTEESEEV